MIKANDYLEIFTLPFGYYLQNQFYTLLTETALLYLPFLLVLISEALKPRAMGAGGITATESALKSIEIRFFSMIVVIMLGVNPYYSGGITTPESMDYGSHSCNDKYRRAIIGEDVANLQGAFTFTHDIESYAPIIQALTNNLATATVNGVISTIPCNIGYRDVQAIMNGVQLESAKTKALINEFSKQCYIPAIKELQYSVDDTSDPSSFVEKFGVVSSPLIARYKDKEKELIFRTNTDLWPTPPHDNISDSGVTAIRCDVAIENITKLVIQDERFQGMKGAIRSMFKNSDEWTLAMKDYGSRDLLYKLGDVQDAEYALVQGVLENAVSPILTNDYVTNINELSTTGLAATSVGTVIATIGAGIMYFVSVATTEVAIEITPWTVSILQGVIAGFGIVILFLTAYSFKTLYTIIVLIIALEFVHIGIEFGAWIDNVAISIMNSKFTDVNLDTLKVKLIAALLGAICYVLIPMFVYKFITVHTIGQTGTNDLSPGADSAAKVGTGVASKLSSKLKSGGSNVAKDINKKLRGTQESANNASSNMGKIKE